MRLIRPRSVPAVSGQLAAGVRAGPGLVGYLGTDAALTALTVGGSAPPGTSWGASWLEVTANNAVLDGYRIPCEVLVKAANVTFRHCKFVLGSGTIYTVNGEAESSGTLTAEDCTVIRTNASPGNVNSAFTSSGATVKLYRCDISGTADAIQPNLFNGTVLSQCYIHDLALVDASAHLDCVQIFQSEAGSTACAVTVEHCWLDAIGSDDPAVMAARTAIVTPNSAITMGQNAGNAFEKYNPVTINNNYLAGGSYHLRILQNTANVSVTNNKFGPIAAFGTHVIENTPAIVAWSGNVDHLGAPVAQ